MLTRPVTIQTVISKMTTGSNKFDSMCIKLVPGCKVWELETFATWLMDFDHRLK